MSPDVIGRIEAIVKHSRAALSALEHAAYNRSGAGYHAGTCACIHARELFKERMPGEETRSPILVVLRDADETELVDRLRGLHDALQVAQNWMTAAGQLTHGPDDRFSYEVWKSDPEPSIDHGPPGLTPAEIRFLNGLRDREWTFDDTEAVVRKVRHVSRAAVGGQVEIELMRAIRSVEDRDAERETAGVCGITIDPQARRVWRSVEGALRRVDLDREPQKWRVFHALYVSDQHGLTEPELLTRAWDGKVELVSAREMIRRLRRTLEDAIGVTITELNRGERYRIIDGSDVDAS